MSLNFYADHKSVYLVFRKQIKGKKIALKYFPGINIDGQSIVKNRTKDSSINKKLIEIELAAIDVIEKIEPENINSETFSELVELKLKNKEPENETNFYYYCDIYFQKVKNETGYDNAKHFNKVKNKLKKFNPVLTFADFDMKFYYSFISWCEKRGYSKNYIGALIRYLKRILNYATDVGENTNLEYKKFRQLDEDVYNVYLTEDEIEKIHRLEIKNEDVKNLLIKNERKKQPTEQNVKNSVEALKKARDLFVLGCCSC